MNIQIIDFNSYTPERIISNEELEDKINHTTKLVPKGIIEKVFGIKSRRFGSPEEHASDLASKAARPLLAKHPDTIIDLLIFASASADLIEPATANIIQHKLGLACPVMDIKNACNSFVSAFQVATGLIETNQYENVLIVTGEKPSDSIRYDYKNEEQLKDSFAAMSFGDAGSAMILGKSSSRSQVLFQKFLSEGKFWELCTIKGGGSMFPHNVDKNFFEGQTAELRTTIIDRAQVFIKNCFAESGVNPQEIDHLFTHQVSINIFKDVVEITEIPMEKCHIVFDKYGNTAASSIPLAMDEAKKEGNLKRGQLVLLIGMAAGISISFQLLRF